MLEYRQQDITIFHSPGFDVLVESVGSGNVNMNTYGAILYAIKKKVFVVITSRVPHAQYHWVVGPTGKRTYAEPTTPGTAPINPTTLMNGYRRTFKLQLVIALKNEGLNVI